MSSRPISADFERRKRALFEAALRLPKDRRAAFVQDQTSADMELRVAVLRLLAAQSITTEGILDTPLHRHAPEHNQAPTFIGAYRVIAELGTGGMGAVYSCQHPATGMRVAIKIAHKELRSDEFLARFAQEREILTRLRHPNVCRVIEAGVTERGAPFIVMELVEGNRIDHVCRSLPPPAILRLFSQVLAGMEYFHRQQIAHRDLKPANVVVTPAGQVRILDFGIAKIIDHLPGATGHGPTHSKSRLMTVRYASPEQLQGRVSGRTSDIYAAGVMLYELLTGIHPYPDEYPVGGVRLLKAMATRPPNPVSVARPSLRVPPTVDRSLARALEYDPLRRYRSAAEFLADIGRCLEAFPSVSTAN